ncbi:hypothetical protein [Empedobacter brevis]|uniref:hypothetical protein n=1 Tax=Empedobacter brevis TaxID=247 RepID=UPI0039AFF12E
MKENRVAYFSKYFFNVILSFFYIFNVSFVFLPSILRTRVLIGFIGFIVFCNIFKKGIPKSFLKIILIILLPIIFIVLTSIINNNLDPRFIGNTFQNLIYIFGAFLLVKRLNFDILLISKVLVASIFLHNVLALIMFLNPNLLFLVVSIQSTGDKFEYALNNVVEFGSRFIGIGIGTFFSGGIIACIGILLSVYILTQINKSKLLWFLIYLFISITGIYIARIAYLGIIISVFFYFGTLIIQKKYTIIPKVFSLLFIIGSIIFLYIINNIDDLMKISSFNHSFEIFINLFNTGEISTKSTEGVKDMLIFPSDLKSILFGDGQFYYENGSFYMHTDVGYSRLVYYYGILGMISFFLIHLYILKFNIKYNKHNKVFRFLLVALTLILFIGNLKGLLDINWLMFIFYWIALKKYYENLSYNK